MIGFCKQKLHPINFLPLTSSTECTYSGKPYAFGYTAIIITWRS